MCWNYLIGSKNHWAINISGTAVDCDEIKSIWYRRPEAPKAHKKTSHYLHSFKSKNIYCVKLHLSLKS